MRPTQTTSYAQVDGVKTTLLLTQFGDEGIEVIVWPHTDQPYAVSRASSFLLGVSFLGLLERLRPSKVLHGFIMLQPLVLYGYSQLGNVDIQMLPAKPTGRCVVQHVILRQCLLDCVVQDGLCYPPLANTRYLHLLAHNVFRFPRQSRDDPGNTRVVAEAKRLQLHKLAHEVPIWRAIENLIRVLRAIPRPISKVVNALLSPGHVQLGIEILSDLDKMLATKGGHLGTTECQYVAPCNPPANSETETQEPLGRIAATFAYFEKWEELQGFAISL